MDFFLQPLKMHKLEWKDLEMVFLHNFHHHLHYPPFVQFEVVLVFLELSMMLTHYTFRWVQILEAPLPLLCHHFPAFVFLPCVSSPQLFAKECPEMFVEVPEKFEEFQQNFIEFPRIS